MLLPRVGLRFEGQVRVRANHGHRQVERLRDQLCGCRARWHLVDLAGASADGRCVEAPKVRRSEMCIARDVHCTRCALLTGRVLCWTRAESFTVENVSPWTPRSITIASGPM